MQSAPYFKRSELRKQMGAKWQPEGVWVKRFGGCAAGPVSMGTAMGRASSDLPWSGNQRSLLGGKAFSSTCSEYTDKSYGIHIVMRHGSTVSLVNVPGPTFPCQLCLVLSRQEAFESIHVGYGVGGGGQEQTELD